MFPPCALQNGGSHEKRRGGPTWTAARFV